MIGLGESINYYPNAVMSLNCGRDFEYKIYCNALPFPFWDGLGMLKSRSLLSLYLHLLTDEALGYILGNFSFHP